MIEVTFCVQGVISPLLANLFLHYVFDLWAARWRRREATGDMVIVRYAMRRHRLRLRARGRRPDAFST